MTASDRKRRCTVAINRMHNVIDACAHGGFHLTKLTSNDRRVLETIPTEERTKELRSLDLNHHCIPVERALGVHWHVESDKFGFRVTIKNKPLTRRGILSTIGSIYDPLGIAAPVLLPGKKILQDLCKERADWDDEIPDIYRHRWEEWKGGLPRLEKFDLNRCFKPDNFGTVVSRQIHSFSDASLTGYGQVSYLRQENDLGQIRCAFLMGKARCSPIKQVTIPRLELTAAGVSVRVSNVLAKELDVTPDNRFYWTDSTTVLKYLTNEKARYKTFVANRVQTIRDTTTPDEWHYVDSALNPADDASRALTMSRFLENKRWINGPSFLWKAMDEWPKRLVDVTVNALDDPEVAVISTNTTVSGQPNEIMGYFSRFSQWYRLERAIAWLLRKKPRQDRN